MAGISYFEYDERSFFGTWRIKKFETFESSDPPPSSDTGITRTEIILDDNNEVRWKTATDAEAIPLFSCETFEVVLTNPAQITFVSSSIGRIGPFTAEFDTSSELQLTYDKAFVLYLEKVPQSEQIQEAPFSFLPALERGYFSDLVITSSSGKNFHAHKVIMQLGCPEQNWDSSRSSTKHMSSRSYQACVLDGLTNGVLGTVLHYLYCESLPSNLSESEARECMNAVSKIPGLERLAKLCGCYLENYAVRKKIEHLCDEVESRGKNIKRLIQTRIGVDEPRASTVQSEPASIFQALKQATREFIVALLKVVQLCKLFADHRNELSREERHTIMKHCRSRLPNLLDLCSHLFESISRYLSRQTEETRREVATYFLAEAEPMFDIANQLVLEIRQALEAIINSDSASKHRPKESVITRTLKNAVHIKELAKLRRLYGEMVVSTNNLMMKREHFGLLSTSEKEEAVSNVLECATDEIPLAIDRVVSLNSNLDSRLSWTRWKYFFKMVTAKVAWVIEKSKRSKQSTSHAIQTVRKLMHSEDFDAGLAALGLIDHVEKTSVTQSSRSSSTSQSQNIESLCIPPVPRDSRLSACAEKLFTLLDTTAEFTDMKFLIHYDKDDEPCTETIKAHRVVVACRCDWFRRALLSGMKEDIKREINVYDCNPDVFKQFLRFLYTGKIDCAEINIDILAEMIALSDRYEMDALKCVCEGALAPHISGDNVLELLSIGEQFNAASLRECCMEYILEHPDVLESNLFNQLPPQLQVEVRELTDWNRRDQARDQAKYSSSSLPRRQRSTGIQPVESIESNNDLSSEMERIDQLTHALHLQQHVSDSEYDDGGVEYFEHPNFEEGPGREPELDACVAGLREVLSEDMSREELARISIAANYDINRALNFYFSSQN